MQRESDTLSVKVVPLVLAVLTEDLQLSYEKEVSRMERGLACSSTSGSFLASQLLLHSPSNPCKMVSQIIKILKEVQTT